MQIKGILFDKDGTLIDFQSLWLQAANEVTDLLIRINGLEKSLGKRNFILEAMGIKDGKVIPDGPLAYQTYTEIGEAVHAALHKQGDEVDPVLIAEQLSVLFESVTARDDFEYREIVPLRPLFEVLRRMQIKIGLATADTATSVRRCFQKLGILEMFDFLGCDDGKLKPKPEKDMFEKSRGKFRMQPQEILVVGDTKNDMIFAHMCGGTGIGVLSGLAKKEDFAGEADEILTSIGELPAYLERN